MSEISGLEKETLRAGCEGRREKLGKAFHADGMVCAKARGKSVTPVKRKDEGWGEVELRCGEVGAGEDLGQSRQKHRFVS